MVMAKRCMSNTERLSMAMTMELSGSMNGPMVRSKCLVKTLMRDSLRTLIESSTGVWEARPSLSI